ncbi:MAG: M48 family metallopeptidase [Muribaculaceae bacterium]|nr:M48 family metallopeptidase [Muribaculaceae bacterium]
MKYYVDDKEFGRVLITLRRGMRHITARWQDEHLEMSAPLGVMPADVRRSLDNLRPRLRQLRLRRPPLSYAIGQQIACFGCTITLVEQNKVASRLVLGRNGPHLTLGIPVGLDLTAEPNKKFISRGLLALVEGEMADRLFPYASEVAREVGVCPTAWQVGRGLRKLGHCTAKGEIQLSRSVMFLPERLVRLVVCHELAHLTHMNHSPQFHALVNAYLHGTEKVLERELKHFAWPVM